MKKFNKGFTLIETIVVIAVIGLTLPVLYAINFAIMRQQVKIYRLSQIKREGDYLINIIENTVKDRAVTIHSISPALETNIVCNKDPSEYSSLTELYFLDKGGQWFGYKYEGSKISSKSADLTNPSINLISSKTLVSNFSISCAKDTIYSPASVSFAFDVCYDAGAGLCTSTRPEEVNSIHYQTRIKLRNY